MAHLVRRLMERIEAGRLVIEAEMAQRDLPDLCRFLGEGRQRAATRLTSGLQMRVMPVALSLPRWRSMRPGTAFYSQAQRFEASRT